MLKFCKSVLEKVSFDPQLFRKELMKATRWLNKKELSKLKVWALGCFSHYNQTIQEVIEELQLLKKKKKILKKIPLINQMRS